MSQLGRLSPWINWDEWQTVSEWFLSSDHSNVKKAIDRVAAWRIRGRIPLGIDATASLWETRLQDISQPDSSSELPLRLQYSMSIIRLVNGIADSSQRGKVAASIASLASAVGIPRALVDLRHQATHNELPSLAVLRSGAGMALQWLEESYWRQQSQCIAVGQSKINDTLQAYIKLHIEAAQVAHTNQMHIDNVDDDDDSDMEEVDQDANNNNKTPTRSGASKPSSSEYNAAEAKKQRKSLLTELKSTVPQASMHLLLPVLLDAYTIDNNSSSNIETALTVVLDHLSTRWPSLCPVLFKTATSQLCQMSTTTTSLIDSNDDKNNNDSDVSIEALTKWTRRFILEIQKAKEKEPKGWRPSQEQLLHVAHSTMKTLLTINCSASSSNSNPSSLLLLKESLMSLMADIVMCLDKNHPGNQRLFIQWNQLCKDNDNNNDLDLMVGDDVVEQAKQNLEKVLKGKAAAAAGDGEERRRWPRVDHHHHHHKECAIGMLPSLFDDNGEVPLLDCEVGDVRVRVRRTMEGRMRGGVMMMKREEGFIQEEEVEEEEEMSGGIGDDNDNNADGGGEERPQKYRRLTVDALDG